MNVFELDRSLVSDYARFARSFTQIRAPDIRAQIEQIYATNRFWPEPLISINPHFEAELRLLQNFRKVLELTLTQPERPISVMNLSLSEVASDP